MAWLNTPVAIVENDQSLLERISYFYNVPTTGFTSYHRTIQWITTRYVGSDYAGAATFRDALLKQYPPSFGMNAPTIEASVQSAGGGQYHVIATVKTISAWVLEV